MLEVLDLYNRRVSMVACPECGSENIQKRGIRAGNRRYRCKDCGRCFTEGANSRGKQIKFIPIDKVCPQCGSTHVIRDGLLETGGQRYKCTDCRKSFSVKTKVRPPVEYKCPYCGGTLRRAGSSKLGEQQYQCKECGRSCTGDPPKARTTFKQVNVTVECPYCGSKDIVLRGTDPKSDLKRYLCKSCEKAFTDNTKVRLERIKNEARSKEVCPRCGGTRIISASIDKNGKQRYKCLDCKRGYTKGAKLVEVYHKRKPELSEKDKRLVIMYRINLGLPITDIAEHFNCSKYAVKQLLKANGHE